MASPKPTPDPNAESFVARAQKARRREGCAVCRHEGASLYIREILKLASENSVRVLRRDIYDELRKTMGVAWREDGPLQHHLTKCERELWWRVRHSGL